MDCHQHAGVQAAATCSGCAEPICPDCTVRIKGVSYCGDCKTLAVPKGAGVPILHECEEANEALKYGIVGFFCFGMILGPLAISKATRARERIAADPTLGGLGKANAGLALGVIATVLWVVNLISRFKS